MAGKVRKVRRCTAKVSSKNQITLPVAALRAAHIHPGDILRVEVDGRGRLTLVPENDPLDAVAVFPGLSDSADLEAERDAWDA